MQPAQRDRENSNELRESVIKATPEDVVDDQMFKEAAMYVRCPRCSPGVARQ